MRLKKGGQERRDALARVRRRRGETNGAAHRTVRLRDGGVGLARQGDHRGAALEVCAPGRRQTDLARAALEQPRAQPRLERRQLPAHRRLRSRRVAARLRRGFRPRPRRRTSRRPGCRPRVEYSCARPHYSNALRRDCPRSAARGIEGRMPTHIRVTSGSTASPRSRWRARRRRTPCRSPSATK